MSHKHNNSQDEWRKEVFEGRVRFKDASFTAPETVRVLPECLAVDTVGCATFDLADVTVLDFVRHCAVFYDNIHSARFIWVLVHLPYALGTDTDFVRDWICTFRFGAVLLLRTYK